MSASGMSPEFEKKLEALAKDLYERGAIIRRNPNAERLPFAPYVEEVEANVAKTMAEVLAEHELAIDYAEYFACTCGRVQLTVNGDHNLHVAQELEAAGYGLVADAKREALESAADDLDLPGSSASGYYASEQDSGYREAERHVEAWLTARAAEMRQG